jgi:hypothetical protein
MLSQILKPRDYIMFINPEISLELALVLKQVNKRRYRSKKEKKTLYYRLYLKAGSEQYLT